SSSVLCFEPESIHYLLRSNTICSQFDFSIGKCWEATTMMPCFPFSLTRTVCSTLLMQQINYSYLEIVSFLFIPVGCNVDLVNYFGNEHIATLGPNKRSRAAENISSQQHFDISLNYNACLDDSDRSASIPNQNPVSTGLRLSYDDDERNSSVTSGSGSMTGAPPTILSLGDLRTELDRQEKELDRYIKVQEENLVKGLRDIEQRHTASFLTALEKGVSQKLREKDLQIETINQKNRELLERINQVATEAQNWQYTAKYNESVVNLLKNNLQQAMSLGPDQGREGFGDNEIDDAASYIAPSNYFCISVPPSKVGSLICRACKYKEVSIMLMPCRHLCLCKDCDGLTSVCPICQLVKTASVQVYLS
ncbi:hypothetical protein C3L33_13477, partial [Rhododendron williamsianum]